jgi:thioredoxin 1
MKILKFYSPTCPPCKRLSQLMLALGKPKYEVEDINISDAKNIVIRNKYLVTGVPTLIVLDDDGNEVKRVVGFSQAVRDTLYGE